MFHIEFYKQIGFNLFQISSSVQWGPADDTERDGASSPPPAKRSRSADHPGRNFSPDRPRSPRSIKRESERDASELRDSLLGQALEGGPTIHVNSTNQVNILFIFIISWTILVANTQLSFKIRIPKYIFFSQIE